MENETQKNPNHFDEITFNELKSFFKSMVNSVGFGFYRIARFTLKNAVYLIVLIALGFGLGYFLERNSTKMSNQKTFDLTDSDQTYEVVVVPNYGSVDFITDWINHYEDEKIKKITISGMKNLYDLADEKESYLETLAIVSRKVQAYSDLLNNIATDKQYRYQKITFVVSKDLDFDAFFKSFQKQISQEPYFQNRKNIELDKLLLRKEELSKSLNQINTLLDTEVTGQSEDLANLVTEKDNLLQILTKVELKIMEGDEILFEVYRFETEGDKISNDKTEKENGKFGKEVKLPVLFVFLFIIGTLGVRTYKKYNTLKQN